MKLLSVLGAIFTCAMLTLMLSPASGNAYPDQATGDPPKAPAKPTLPPGTPAEQIQTLIKQHDKAMTAFLKLYNAAKTEEEEDKLESLVPNSGPYSTLLLQIAEKNPKDPFAVDALVWAWRKSYSVKAKAILIRDHLLNPKIGPLCMSLEREARDVGTVPILRRVLSENPGKEAQAQAAYALAKVALEHGFLARMVQKADAKELAKLAEVNELSKEAVAYFKGADAKALEKEGEALLEKVTKDKVFAETTILAGLAGTRLKLGDLAGAVLFEKRHLQPGMVAPDIVGEDIDGKPMKLSDFRGKVVLLDFWGHW